MHIANIFTKQQQVGFGGNSYIQEIDVEYMVELGISDEVLQDLAGFLLEGVERASVFLQSAGK